MPSAENHKLWRRRLIVFAVWLVVGLALHLMQTPLYWRFWILGFVLLQIHLIWGIFQAAYNLYLGSAERHHGVALLSLANAAAIGFLVVAPLWEWGDRLVFLFFRSRYDRIVADAEAGILEAPKPTPPFYGYPYPGEHDGIMYGFRVGEPDLIVFSWLMGVPDGGTAIVYSRSADLESQPDARLTSMLGEDVQACWPFVARYYKCYYD